MRLVYKNIRYPAGFFQLSGKSGIRQIQYPANPVSGRIVKSDAPLIKKHIVPKFTKNYGDIELKRTMNTQKNPDYYK